jgi:hypothetical protein
MPGRALDLRVDAGRTPGGVVETAYELEFFGERMNREAAAARRESPRVDRVPLFVQALGNTQ